MASGTGSCGSRSSDRGRIPTLQLGAQHDGAVDSRFGFGYAKRMASFILIPPAGGAAWVWHRVVPLLEKAGHEAVPVELPGPDPKAGLSAYADVVVRAIGQRRDPMIVAMSMGGFTAPLVCERVSVGGLVFVNALIPRPGETVDAWWGNTGSSQARKEAAKRDGYGDAFDIETYFFHDVPRHVVEAGAPHEKDEADIAVKEPCLFEAWPSAPTRVVIGAADRFFPASFQERLARERLAEGTPIERIRGGHLVALSQPDALAARLGSFAK
jgi:pimeloyl-ACP methyl ester carboxylesterase